MTLGARQLDISDVIDGCVESTAAGPCFVAERSFALETRHGRERVADALDLPAEVLGVLAREPGWPALNPRDVLFLDTETTGLSGGTGTYVFMVGVGRFLGDQFVVRQLFMRDFGEEAGVLRALESFAAGARHLITFNGRSFDWPLLETRFLMATRSRPGWRPAVHLDLLLPARRVWRGRLESCSLSSLERAVIGHQREDDVPGWAIPSLYFGYVRHGDCLPMQAVFRHNLDDVLSLAALLARLGRMVRDSTSEAQEPEDLLAIGRLYEEAGRPEQAARVYEHALVQVGPSLQRALLLARLAAVYKRQGRPQSAAELWRQQIALDVDADVTPMVELAKHCEHRARDVPQALSLVGQALTVLELREAGHFASRASQRPELERRLARLLRKAAALRDRQARHSFTGAIG